MSASDRFTLYPYSEVHKYVRVVNIEELGYTLSLRIPSDISKRCELFQIDEILPNKHELDYVSCTDRKCNSPWIDIKLSALNTKSGQHMYKFSFIDRCTDEIENLYFSYIIYTDNPEKPYIYMRNEDDDKCY